MKDVRQGIDAEAPAEEIVAILAKYGITVGLIDQVFKRAKNRAINRTIVTSEKIINNQERIFLREKLLKKTLGINTFDKVMKDIRVLLQNYNLDVRPEMAQDLIVHTLLGSKGRYRD